MLSRLPFVARPRMSQLVLKRASASRPSVQWQDEDYDVLADGKEVGRTYEDAGAAAGRAPRSRRRRRLPPRPQAQARV
jgi:hypothetical protein